MTNLSARLNYEAVENQIDDKTHSRYLNWLNQKETGWRRFLFKHSHLVATKTNTTTHKPCDDISTSKDHHQVKR
jgi:hypothetical protein